MDYTILIVLTTYFLLSKNNTRSLWKIRYDTKMNREFCKKQKKNLEQMFNKRLLYRVIFLTYLTHFLSPFLYFEVKKLHFLTICLHNFWGLILFLNDTRYFYIMLKKKNIKKFWTFLYIWFYNWIKSLIAESVKFLEKRHSAVEINFSPHKKLL